MCGIAGIFHLDQEPVSPVILKKMTDAIAHRGPDGEGQYIDHYVGLGHRRLAIIDLSPAGHQPMITKDGRFILSFNGEIYNHHELRIELEANGYQFHSRTDTEVLLYAYAQWGEKCLDRFNGMFAFSIWDRQKQELFLARDRYGIKPLYYSLIGQKFLFGSEIKAIFANPIYHKEIDLEGLLEYFTFQNFFTDKTLFKNVKLLPSGNYLKIALREQKLIQEQYWDYHFSEPNQVKDQQEYIEELDRLFVQAVSRQLMSDVELGSYLSGGMDSGSITAIAAQQLPYLKSFTCGFDLNSASGIEVSYDERETAEYMSYLFKTEHYEMVLKAGDMERIMPRLAYHLEEPRVGQSYPNFYASQLASKFVKVVLAGTGGDELFGGYPWRYYRAVVNDNFEHYVDQYYGFWQRLLTPDEIKNVFAPIWSEVQHIDTRELFRSVFKEPPHDLTRPEDYVNNSLYFEAKTFMNGLLVVEDKLSMAHSLETRVPFLDNDLVNFAMKIPVSLKLGNLTEVIKLNENDPGNKTAKYFQKTKDGKLILRQVMSNYIPTSITNREKQGFSAPDGSWFKGESIDYVKQKIKTKNSRIYDFLHHESLEQLINQHLNGEKNRRLLIWSLLNLDECFNQFLA
jgi:asparagine synthase (glutamine-hydrolysing)